MKCDFLQNLRAQDLLLTVKRRPDPEIISTRSVLRFKTTWLHMPKTPSQDERLKRLSEIALALPEAKRQIFGSHATFLVRKRPFAYFLDNHHGDGIIAIACKVLPGENSALVESQPERFYLPAYVGPRGWVALRLDRGRIAWGEVKELLRASYLMIAPKRPAERLSSKF